jgi:hypothetical protein
MPPILPQPLAAPPRQRYWRPSRHKPAERPQLVRHERHPRLHTRLRRKPRQCHIRLLWFVVHGERPIRLFAILVR